MTTKRKQYTDEQRAELVRQVDALKADGKSTFNACKTVGISQYLFTQWSKVTAPAANDATEPGAEGTALDRILAKAEASQVPEAATEVYTAWQERSDRIREAGLEDEADLVDEVLIDFFTALWPEELEQS